MLTVKAFDRGLVCKGFRYEVGIEYSMPKDEVKICEKGFHASANCDISETLSYYPNIKNNEYALVDINVVNEEDDKVVGDKIKILKKLTFDECIKYDKTGLWCFEYGKLSNIGEDSIRKLENAVIEKDKGGKLCYLFAKNIKGANIRKLENAVIEKDKEGRWCYLFAKNIRGANIGKLEDAVIEKDKEGEWCYYFAKSIKDVDIKKLENAVIDKDKEGMWCFYFAKDIVGADIKKLKEAVIKKDENGIWSYFFTTVIWGG